jgi:hypothetical protein
VDEGKALGRRLRELRCWHRLTLREAAGLARLSLSFWAQVGLDRTAQYQRSVTAAESLTSWLDNNDAVQACGMLHLSAALAAGAQADHDTAATHLAWIRGRAVLVERRVE